MPRWNLRWPARRTRPAVRCAVLLELGLVDVAVDESGARARVTSAERTDLSRSETFAAAERRLAAGVAALAGAKVGAA